MTEQRVNPNQDLMQTQPGDILILHLNSNQTVIAQFETETEHGFVVSAPLVLIAREVSGKLQFGTAPFLTLGGELPALDLMVIPYSSILLPRACPEKFARLYKQALTPIDLSAVGKSPLIRT